jgi:sugar phosphate isomerase/epimerase
MPLEDALAKLKSFGISTVELGTGNYPGDAHCKLSMLDDAAALRDFKKKLDDHGFSISALSCHGNPLHPNPSVAQKAQETNRKTILLAEKLGVSVVVDFSGCPGDSPTAKAPNWVTCPWPPEYLDVLAWQWEKVATPYWKEHGKFAADHGVKVAVEMHPGFLAYSPETMLRLRDIAGPSVGCNYDPSHMFWQGIDPIKAIRVLGDSIFHVHAKDGELVSHNIRRSGMIPQGDWQKLDRGFRFRIPGWGSVPWKKVLTELSMIGYDYVMSYEHEDVTMSRHDGITKTIRFLKPLVIEKPYEGRKDVLFN